MFEDLTQVEFGRSGLVELPFQFEPMLLRCMAAGPGGHPLHVLIDTGTDPSAMDLRLARRLAVQMGGTGLGRGAASDAVAFTEAQLPWLRLGDLTIRQLCAPAVDLANLPFPVDVVLGYSVLRQVTLRIDYAAQRLTLAHPDLGAPAGPGAVRIPLLFFEHFPAVRDLLIDDHHLPLATIDTGSNSALTLGPDVAAALGLARGAHDVQGGVGAGFGGASQVLRRRCRTVRLGPCVLDDVEVETLGSGAGDFSRLGRANIGNRLLARFRCVTLDYERQTLTLE